MYQKVTILGRLGGDPQMRYTQEGKPVTKLNVAANYGKDKVAWFVVSVWERQAEFINDNFKKGDIVFVEGVLQPGEDGNPRQWQGKDNTFHSSYEVTAHVVKGISAQKKAGAEDEEDLPF